MREIVLKRLVEIREALVRIKPKLDKKSDVYKQVEESLKEINKALEGQNLTALPESVRVDTSQLKIDGSKLTGKAVLSDESSVFDVSIEKDKVTSCSKR
ncbi:hypothetical protein HY992_02380 [Candidatus Micrarchaeota archaeon]|nr:hypothetical protein [Candidatus Micrarchaeota archaeon]